MARPPDGSMATEGPRAVAPLAAQGSVSVERAVRQPGAVQPLPMPVTGPGGEDRGVAGEDGGAGVGGGVPEELGAVDGGELAEGVGVHGRLADPVAVVVDDAGEVAGRVPQELAGLAAVVALAGAAAGAVVGVAGLAALGVEGGEHLPGGVVDVLDGGLRRSTRRRGGRRRRSASGSSRRWSRCRWWCGSAPRSAGRRRRTRSRSRC